MKKAAAYPYIVWMALFTIIPMLLIVYYGFTIPSDGGARFSLAPFARVFEPMYIGVLGHSMWFALVSTVFCLLMGYPVAYILAGRKSKTSSTIIFLFLVPMWMNFLLRTYAWLTILEQNGILNFILNLFHLPSVNILYTDAAIILGMVYNFVPFMILPIYNVLRKMDSRVIEAAQDLGANSLQVFLRVVFPLSIPGVVSGVVMVFMPAVTTFVISDLLGGGRYLLVGNLIERQFLYVGDWNFGSAVSVILMLVILASNMVFSFVDGEGEGGSLF